LSAAGAKLAITYQNERLKAEAHDLIAALPNAEGFQCDLANDSEIDQLFAQLKERYGRIDALAHCVAYAPADAMHGDFINTSREAFRIAHDVSVYTLIAITRAAAPLMAEGGSVVTLSYFGAEKVVPGYNVMGVAKASLEATVRYLANSVGPSKIRVNAISAGPIKNVDVKEVGETALFLCSDMATGITGETIYVDCGYNIMGF
jgi:enoyl-[acyl-carrier protein] reductase I